MEHKKISAKQLEILEYIKSEVLKRGYPPAVRDICQAVGLRSTSSVHSHLETLEKNGYIRKDPSKPRAIEIVDDRFNASRKALVMIPRIRAVPEGKQLLDPDNIEGYFPLLRDCLPGQPAFIAKVKDQGMSKAGILEGDDVLILGNPEVSAGDTVAAVVDGSLVIRAFAREGGEAWLKPENDSMGPVPAGGELRILGKVVGVMRFLADPCLK